MSDDSDRSSLRSGYAGPMCGVLTALGGKANAVVWQVAGAQQGTLPAACVTGFGARQRTPQCLSASILRRVHDANRADASPAFAELTGRSLHARRCSREGIQHAWKPLVGALQPHGARGGACRPPPAQQLSQEELPLVRFDPFDWTSPFSMPPAHFDEDDCDFRACTSMGNDCCAPAGDASHRRGQRRTEKTPQAHGTGLMPF